MPSVDDLRGALQSSEQSPPPASQFLDAIDSRMAAPPHHPLLPAIVAVCVVAVALVGMVVGQRRSHDGTPAASSAAPISTDPAQLVGIEWQLFEVVPVAGGKPILVTNTASARDAVLRFAGNGAFSAFDSCNDLGGHVAIAAGGLDVGATSVTDAACVDDNGKAAIPPDPRAIAARAVDAMFSGHVNWAVQDAQLTLRKTGFATLVYRSGP